MSCTREIVYTGTAEYEEFVQPWRAQTSVAHPTEQDRRSVDRYGLYEVRDNEAAVREALQRYNPSLADRFVNRTAPALIDKATARRIIAEAYAAAVSVDPPDNATAARTQAVHALRRHRSEQLEEPAAGAEGQTTASGDSSR